MSNSPTEKKAIELVIAYECKRLKLNDSSKIKPAKKGSGYDLISQDGRKIEVKGSKQSKFNYGLRLNSEQEIGVFKKGVYMYRVTDVFENKPKLYIVEGKKDYLRVKKWAACCVPSKEQGDPIDL